LVIGIDYTAAAWQGAGIGRYTRELVRAAVAQDNRHNFRLFYAAGGLPANSPYVADLRRLCADHPHVRAAPIPLTPQVLTRLWQRLRLPLPVELLVGRIDIVHAPDFVLPPTRARTLLTVHDLSFLIGPQWCDPGLRRYLARAVPRSLRRANMVVADSYATRDDLVRLLGADPQRVAVIHLGVDARFRPLPTAALEETRQRLGLPERFIFFVGTLEPRKNLVRLIEAFHLLSAERSCKDDRQLVIAGRKGWLYDEIFATVERLGLQGRVRFLDFLNDSDLPVVYNLAQLVAYVPLYEGFGLPALEALACGAPVVASAVSSLPEVVGAAQPAAVLVDPYDSAAIAAGMQQALCDEQLASRMRAAGPQQARAFTWERAARELLACYEKLVNTWHRTRI
jgi:glycosyltransferase involved in cell wall biosynthesis